MTEPKYQIEGLFDPGTASPNDSHTIQTRLIPENSRVLELGCATGYISGYLETVKQCRVTGIEADTASAEIAAERCSEVHVQDLDAPDALKAAEASAPYDLLYAANVLEHLKYPERVLQQGANLLAPNGLALVALPNIAYWRSRLNLLLGKFDYTDYGLMDRTHVHFYTVASARQLLQENGFIVEELHIAGSFLQNVLSNRARRQNRPLPKPVFPGLLAYEMIFLARRAG